MVNEKSFELIVSGGGLHNPQIMNRLKEEFPNAGIRPSGELGIDSDAKEAALMAYLANELVLGRTFEVNGEQVSLGKISIPG